MSFFETGVEAGRANPSSLGAGAQAGAQAGTQAGAPASPQAGAHAPSSFSGSAEVSVLREDLPLLSSSASRLSNLPASGAPSQPLPRRTDERGNVVQQSGHTIWCWQTGRKSWYVTSISNYGATEINERPVPYTEAEADNSHAAEEAESGERPQKRLAFPPENGRRDCDVGHETNLPQPPDHPLSLEGAAAAWFEGNLYVVGGRSCNSDEPQHSCEVWFWDPRALQLGWQRAPSLVTGRAYHALVVFRERMYVLGGISVGTLSRRAECKELSSVESYT